MWTCKHVELDFLPHSCLVCGKNLLGLKYLRIKYGVRILALKFWTIFCSHAFSENPPSSKKLDNPRMRCVGGWNKSFALLESGCFLTQMPMMKHKSFPLLYAHCNILLLFNGNCCDLILGFLDRVFKTSKTDYHKIWIMPIFLRISLWGLNHCHMVFLFSTISRFGSDAPITLTNLIIPQGISYLFQIIYGTNLH